MQRNGRLPQVAEIGGTMCPTFMAPWLNTSVPGAKANILREFLSVKEGILELHKKS